MNACDQVNLIERYIAAYNRFNVDGMVELLADSVVFTNIENSEITAETTGIEAFRELAEKSTGLFSARRQQIINHRFLENGISVDIDFAGTLAVDMPGGPRAGEKLLVAGRSDFVIEEGKIVGITDVS